MNKNRLQRKGPASKVTGRLGNTLDQAFIQTVPFIALRSRRVMSKLDEPSGMFGDHVGANALSICGPNQRTSTQITIPNPLISKSGHVSVRLTFMVLFLPPSSFRSHHGMSGRFVPNAPWILPMFHSHNVFSAFENPTVKDFLSITQLQVKW